jgi:hypothetical protein
MPVALTNLGPSIRANPILQKSTSFQNTCIPSPTITMSNTNYIRPQGLNNSNTVTAQRLISKPISITPNSTPTTTTTNQTPITSKNAFISASSSTLSSTTQQIHSCSYSKLKSSNFKFVNKPATSNTNTTPTTTYNNTNLKHVSSVDKPVDVKESKDQQSPPVVQQPVSLIKKSFTGSFRPEFNAIGAVKHPRHNSTSSSTNVSSNSTSKNSVIPQPSSFKSRLVPPSSPKGAQQAASKTNSISTNIEHVIAANSSSTEIKRTPSKVGSSMATFSGKISEIPVLKSTPTTPRAIPEATLSTTPQTSVLDASKLQETPPTVTMNNLQSKSLRKQVDNVSGSSLTSQTHLSSINTSLTSSTSTSMNMSSNMSSMTSSSSLMKVTKTGAKQSSNVSSCSGESNAQCLSLQHNSVVITTTPSGSTSGSVTGSTSMSASTSPSSFPSPSNRQSQVSFY